MEGRRWLVVVIAAFCGITFAQDDTEKPSDVVDAPALEWLTPAENDWVKAHPVLKNGVVDGHTPFEFINDDGEHSGLAADYLKIVGERLGIRFEAVVVDSFAELGGQMAAGNIDVSTYLPRISKWNEVLSFSDPVISMPIAVFGRQDSPLVLSIASIPESRLAVERPSRAAEFLSRDLPTLNPTYVDSPGEGLRAVARGQADYFVHNIFSVEFYQRTLGLEPLKTVATTNYTYDIRFATSREQSPLVPIIHKVISGMSDYERTLIFDKWVNIRIEKQFDWQKAIVWGGAVLAILLFIFAFILHWNRRLVREVDARTRDLVQSKESLRALARHMDRVREEEKSRLALEIHDELGHTLTALDMAVRRFANFRKKSGESLSAGTGSDDEHIEEVRGLVKEASHISRRIMSDLRPSVLEDLGLVAALEWLVHEFESHHDIRCVIDAEDLETELAPGAGIALFRIVQESLTNIAKHAGASLAQVTLSVSDDELILEVEDDGKGLDSDWKNRDGSFGLLGMSERAQALGGELCVANNAEGGACIVVRMPLAGTPVSDKSYTEKKTSPIVEARSD
jgi:signal transduction histidine kinase